MAISITIRGKILHVQKYQYITAHNMFLPILIKLPISVVIKVYQRKVSQETVFQASVACYNQYRKSSCILIYATESRYGVRVFRHMNTSQSWDTYEVFLHITTEWSQNMCWNTLAHRYSRCVRTNICGTIARSVGHVPYMVLVRAKMCRKCSCK